MAIAEERTASNICWSKTSLCADAEVRVYFKSTGKIGSRLYRTKHGEYLVELCRITRCAESTLSKTVGHFVGFSSRTITKEFFLSYGSDVSDVPSHMSVDGMPR